MVMEVTPQCVGMEFVRQYYTILNKAPEHLHRFYSHNSSFMHGGNAGGRNDPAIGQEDIHKKITSLNFQDCHAKIRMIDAFATLSNGVVIQVTGELSNSGMPMRRFMQTFVLAPQTPKKFYVHNDIFRYQDDVFNDSENGEEPTSDLEEEIECPPASDASYTSTPQTTTLNGSAHPEPESSTPPAQSHIVPTQVVGSTAVITPTPTTNTTQTSLSPTPATPVPADPAPPSSPPPVDHGSRWSGPEAEGWGTVIDSDMGGWEDAGMMPHSEKLPDPDPPQADTANTVTSLNNPSTQNATQAPPSSNEPKTFANLFKNGGGGYAGTLPPLSQPPLANNNAMNTTPSVSQPPIPQTNNTMQSPPLAPTPQLSTSPSQQNPGVTQPQQSRMDGGSRMSNSSATSSSMSQGPPNSYMKPRPSQNRPMNRDRPPYRSSFDDNSDMGERGQWGSRSSESLEDRRRPMVSDSQQIFVGNLPHVIGEDELRSEFSKFGRILDVRINTTKGKTGMKGPGGHQVPNFGFITFDDENAVAKCLDSKPIMLNNEHRVNVEEKKTKRNDLGGSGGGGPGRPGSGRGGMGNSLRGGSMGGGPQGRGGPRGPSGAFNRGGSGGGPRGGYQRR